MNGRRKVFNSFHDLPPSEYMYFPKGTLNGGKPGKFSMIETTHLIISIVILTVAFTFALTGNNVISGFRWGFKPNALGFGIAISFLGIVSAFFVHELSHKFMAQKYGLWAEYRMYPKGLILALLLGIITPFVFAAPGAVMFRGETRNFETGRIAAAGPSANIIIAGITFGLYHFVFFEEVFIGKVIGFICLVNALLGTFNLLPYGPLDGGKVFHWNGIVWSILMTISIILLVSILYRGIPDFTSWMLT